MLGSASMPTDDQPRAPGHAEKRYGANTRRVSVWLPESLAVAVGRLARAEGRPVGAMVRTAVEAFVASREGVGEP